jgi:hypothetical protein
MREHLDQPVLGSGKRGLAVAITSSLPECAAMLEREIDLSNRAFDQHSDSFLLAFPWSTA